MTRRYLLVDFEKCTGCRTCEIACSLAQKRTCNPYVSNISIVGSKKRGLFVPIVCQQCESAVCEEVCPAGAIERNSETGALTVSQDKCIGCRMCLIACPFGGMTLDIRNGHLWKCDLCGGDPMCVKFCEPNALQFIAVTNITKMYRQKGAKKLAKALEEISDS